MILLGVDPGTNYCGVAIFDIDDNTLEIKNIQATTLNLTRPAYSYYQNSLIERLETLYRAISNIVLNNDVYWLAIEAGYMSRLQPSAYGPLSKCINTVESSFINTTLTYNITEYSPSVMKSVLKTASNDKDDMKRAVEAVPELARFTVGQSEHAIDAMAIGYTKLLDIRSNPECIFYTIR